MTRAMIREVDADHVVLAPAGNSYEIRLVPTMPVGAHPMEFNGDQGSYHDTHYTVIAATPSYVGNPDFKLVRLTDDAAEESDLRRFPGETKKMSFVLGRGDLFTMHRDGTKREQHLTGWEKPSYSFSPDGKWLAWSRSDDDFNRDVWIRPIDRSRPDFNISCHPDNDFGPVWSADGKYLAFTGRRWQTEYDIVWVTLAREDAAARIYPIAAATRGLAGEVMTEMSALRDAGAVAFSDAGRPIMASGKSMALRRRIPECR